MTDIVGDINSLPPSVRTQLQRLETKRTHPDEIIDLELARRIARICANVGVMIAVLIGRDGRITHTIVGTKHRIYLPDLGRFRLDSARLRRLRLIAFSPTMPEGDSARLLTRDLVTDLEKLRLDAVAVAATTPAGEPAQVVFAHLRPQSQTGSNLQKRRGDSSTGHSVIKASHLRELSINFLDFISDLESQYVASADTTVETDGERAVLVGAYAGSAKEASLSMAELTELARTAGLNVVDTVIQRRKAIDPKSVIGRGKIEELVLHCLDLGADLVVFDRELSSAQLRSITNSTELRVIDRSMLILDIFAQRAVTSEGRLQVELAQLKYSLPRLTEKDTGLSRLTGGIGGRGPGETKLEIGRRRARDRISELEKRIDKLGSQRGVRRELRKSRGVPVVGIVGYTNAGKSTLMNQLTQSAVLVENKLFATLDPTSRRMRFPDNREVLFVDTVGFIRDLPKELVNAFRATLEEVAEADLLIHLIDISNPEAMRQKRIVEETLKALELDTKPVLLVLNKIDKLSEVEGRMVVSATEGIPISALNRLGFEELVIRLREQLVHSFQGQDPGDFVTVYHR